MRLCLYVVALCLAVAMLSPVEAATWEIAAGHSAAVNAVALSPDGKMVATASDDGTVRLWRTDSGTLTAILHPGTAPMKAVAFSGDGRLVASGSTSLCVWDVSSHRCLKESFAVGRVRALAWRGGALAAAGEKGVACWDSLGSRPLVREEKNADAIAFSADGESLLVPTLGAIRFVPRRGGEAKVVSIPEFGEATQVLVAAPFTTLWESEDIAVLHGRGVIRCDARRTEAAGGAPDGVLLAADGVISRCSQPSLSVLESVRVPFPSRISALVGSRRWWVAGTWNGDVIIWDRTRLAAPPRIIRGLPGVHGIGCNGRQIAVGRNDFHTDLWSFSDGAPTRRDGYAVAGYADQWVTSGPGQSVMWDGQGRRLVRERDPMAEGTVAWSPDGKTIATAELGGRVTLREARTLAVQSTRRVDTGTTHAMVFSPNNQWLAVVGNDNDAEVWDLSHNDKVTLHGHTDRVNAVVWVSDALLATASSDKTIRLWDIPSGHNRSVITETATPAALATAGGLVISGDEDGALRWWDPQTQRMRRRIDSHQRSVTALWAYGDAVLSGADDGTVALWRNAQLQITLCTLPDGGWTVFTPDGRYDGNARGIATLRRDGRLVDMQHRTTALLRHRWEEALKSPAQDVK